MNEEQNILYHYTSLEVLKCMFDNYSNEHQYLTFWATNCAYMNDPREISEGIDLIKDALYDIECPALRQRASVIIENDKIKDALLITSPLMKTGVAYAISFSENSDNINMWRMYGNEGKGIALGFDRNKIIVDDCSFDFCFYNNDKERESLLEEIRKAFETILVKIGTAPYGISQRNYDYLRCLDAISMFAPRIKNAAYDYEKESRLVTYCKKPEFRVSNGILIPYTTLQIPVEALESIILGPDCDSRNIDSLRLFLLSKGIDRLVDKIDVSEVPYRN